MIYEDTMVLTKEGVWELTARYVWELAARFKAGDEAIIEDYFGQLCEYFSDEMPYGTMKARDGDPYIWLANKLENM